MEVARQCSNLAPPLQWAVREHRSIRRRTKSAMVPHVCEQTGPQPIPRLTEAMLDEAQCRYEGGETLRRIAVDLGVSRDRLARRLRSHGATIRREGPTTEQVLEMVRRYDQGESLARVGARLGFSGGTVRTHLIRAGVRLRDSHGRAR